jgi:putative hydrolase of the HAD superfamily
MVYKNLFFDLDNTLWAFSENAYDTFQEVYFLHHLNKCFDSFEQFYSIYQKENERLWDIYGKGEITKEELNHRRFLYPLQAVGAGDSVLAEKYSTDFFKIIRTKKKLMPHTIEVLNSLYPHFNLYILSNGFRELQRNKMHAAGIDGYFKQIILSDDIGVQKPNWQLFVHALQVTQSESCNSLMIGDNFEVDIEGARNVGLAQIFYNISNRKDLSFNPTYLITDLKELIDILE